MSQLVLIIADAVSSLNAMQGGAFTDGVTKPSQLLQGEDVGIGRKLGGLCV